MIVEGRRQVLVDFFGAHPERFVNGAPKPPEIPSAAWINPPTTKTTHQIGAQAVSEASDDLQVPLICNIYGEPVVSNSAASVNPHATQPRANSGKPGVTVSSAVRRPWVREGDGHRPAPSRSNPKAIIMIPILTQGCSGYFTFLHLFSVGG